MSMTIDTEDDHIKAQIAQLQAKLKAKEADRIHKQRQLEKQRGKIYVGASPKKRKMSHMHDGQTMAFDPYASMEISTEITSANKENQPVKSSDILSRLNAQRKDLKKVDIVKTIQRSKSFSQPAPTIPHTVRDAQPKVKKAMPSISKDDLGDHQDVQHHTGLALKSRQLSEKDFESFLEDRYFCTVSHLLGICKPPSWDVPVIGDYVTAGILVEKSSPLVSKNSHGPTRKHVLLTLSDFKLSITVMLVDGAYDQWWKESEGSVIAILNAKVMGPKGHNTSIMLIVDSASSILLIGKARDFGICKAICKDGKPCTTHVNKRHTEYCEFHTNSAFEKVRSSRMAVASSVGFYGPKKRSKSYGHKGSDTHQDGLLEETGTFGRVQTDSGGKVYCVKRTQGALKAPSDLSEEILQKRLNNKKERLSKQDKALDSAVKSLLSSRPGSVGAQYLQAQGFDNAIVTPSKHSQIDNSFMFMPEAVRRIGFNPIGDMHRDTKADVAILSNAINKDTSQRKNFTPSSRVVAKSISTKTTDIDLDSD